MSEDDDEIEPATIESTKTVVVAEDVHNAISHIATDEERPIKEIVDDKLRGDGEIQKELEIRKAKAE